MPELYRATIDRQANQKIEEILQAADRWAREAPPALTPPIRAVCVRLAEMVADQRHYLPPLPEPQEAERRAVLTLVAECLRQGPAITGVEAELEALAALELRATGSWATVPGAQVEWINTSIQFLESRAATLPPEERPDPYWADDVVAGIIASVRALIGVDQLQARTEAQFGHPTGEPVE
ncbi:MAG: hypothetical protein ACOY71_09330 [Gemmatimonadota bacterium]